MTVTKLDITWDPAKARTNLDKHGISFADAALGGELEVPTLDGRVKLKIPEGTQTGKQFRLKGKGMPVLRSSQFGDMYIQVAVETPVNLSKLRTVWRCCFNPSSPSSQPQSLDSSTP